MAFPLYLRIPKWSTGAVVRVNGTVVTGTVEAGSFVVVDQTWNNGDKVTVTLPMRTTVRTWAKNGNAISVDNGPLTFSLSIAERWQRIGGTDAWPTSEVYANSPWNYGLLIDPANPQATVTRKPGALAANPFTRDGAPGLAERHGAEDPQLAGRRRGGGADPAAEPGPLHPAQRDRPAAADGRAAGQDHHVPAGQRRRRRGRLGHPGDPVGVALLERRHRRGDQRRQGARAAPPTRRSRG